MLLNTFPFLTWLCTFLTLLSRSSSGKHIVPHHSFSPLGSDYSQSLTDIRCKPLQLKYLFSKEILPCMQVWGSSRAIYMGGKLKLSSLFAVQHLRAAVLPGDGFTAVWKAIEISISAFHRLESILLSLTSKKTILQGSNEIVVEWMRNM